MDMPMPMPSGNYKNEVEVITGARPLYARRAQGTVSLLNAKHTQGLALADNEDN